MSSTSWAAPSTTCSTGCTRRSSGCTRPSTGSSGSPATPRTSSARRWRPCSARSRSRSAATARPEEYRRVLERVQAEGSRLRQIVESLLLLAQFEGGRPEPEHDRPRRLGARPPPAMVEPPAGGGPAPRSSTTTAPTVVRVHPPLLAQLVDNLLENACKYSEPGTPIVVRSWHEGGSVALGVEDRGRGLAAEELAHVFEPFFRGEPAHARRSPGRRPRPGRGAADRRHLRRDARGPERAGGREPLHPALARGRQLRGTRRGDRRRRGSSTAFARLRPTFSSKVSKASISNHEFRTPIDLTQYNPQILNPQF